MREFIVGSLMEFAMEWKEVNEERYMEMLEILPPRLWLYYGFLVGEPTLHRACRITKIVMPAFAPFVTHKGKFWEGSEAMTVPEFRALELESVGRQN